MPHFPQCLLPPTITAQTAVEWLQQGVKGDLRDSLLSHGSLELCEAIL